MAGLITYKIVSDQNDKLKNAARTACNFWNHYITSDHHIVIRLGLFTESSDTIACSYKPYTSKGVTYGRVDFNTEYLDDFSNLELAGTIAHELGHTLGFGWNKWMKMFDHATGKFKQEYIEQLPELKPMRVETDYGDGTQFSHWDEATFGKEIMTGFKDKAEFIMPVTIDVMALLGHHVVQKLEKKTKADVLLESLATKLFSRKEDAKQIDRDHYEETDLWETVPRASKSGDQSSHV
jgi:hypothetical protein